MPPRKAKAAVEDDQCPSLKLIMEKGPLSGQTNDFRPGVPIRIGRVVRGNSLAIKDAGISTKHLIIQAEPVSDGRRHWTLSDLGSSNGTFLNGQRLEPSEPAALSDGDVIIIGEQTSIKVKFEDCTGEAEVSKKNVRRNARRGVSKQVEELGVIDEDSELGLGFKSNLGPGAIKEKLGAVGGEKGTGRRTRGSKAEELENGSKGKIESEKSENLIIGVDDDEEKKNHEVVEAEAKEGKNVSNVAEPSLVKAMERVSVRRTRSSRKEENVDEPLLDLSFIEGKRTRKGMRGRKNIAVEMPLDVKETEETNLEEQNVREEEKRASERENATEFASTSGVKEGEVEAGNGEVVMDLEKMTLGEYLEFLEVYLTKQIVDETEQMITEMRRDAKRVHEYVLQKKKNATRKG